VNRVPLARPNLFDAGIDVRTIDGRVEHLSDYRGRTLLVVNVASQCGYTPQYAGLEKLYRTYKDRGLVVMGFPCDQFGHQEPGTEAEIQQFCSLNYGVTFPMFAKIDVNGANAHPLYVYLKSQKKGILGLEGIKWNFTKFLVSPSGEVVRRYGPSDTPEEVEKDAGRLLAAG
jgi:glutathione peroxidase